jgi:hypothetical protein
MVILKATSLFYGHLINTYMTCRISNTFFKHVTFVIKCVMNNYKYVVEQHFFCVDKFQIKCNSITLAFNQIDGVEVDLYT